MRIMAEVRPCGVCVGANYPPACKACHGHQWLLVDGNDRYITEQFGGYLTKWTCNNCGGLHEDDTCENPDFDFTKTYTMKPMKPFPVSERSKANYFPMHEAVTLNEARKLISDDEAKDKR